MNKAILLGPITRDPEIRYSQGENPTAIARFTIAVDRKFKKADDTQKADFIGCIAFGKQAEFIDKYFRKGMKMAAVGRIQTGSYTNKDGQKIYTTDVVIEDVEFAESKKADNECRNAHPEPSAAEGDGFMNIPDGLDEQLPFN